MKVQCLPRVTQPMREIHRTHAGRYEQKRRVLFRWRTYALTDLDHGFDPGWRALEAIRATGKGLT